MTARLSPEEIKKIGTYGHEYEASDQRQYEAEMLAAKTEYDRAMTAAAKSVGCCKICGREVSFGDMCYWCGELE